MTQFNTNTKIRAYDFKPMADRSDSFIEGTVVSAGMIKHPTLGCDLFEGYEIVITGSSVDDDPRIGDTGYVPFKVDFMEFEGRITAA